MQLASGIFQAAKKEVTKLRDEFSYFFCTKTIFPMSRKQWGLCPSICDTPSSSLLPSTCGYNNRTDRILT